MTYNTNVPNTNQSPGRLPAQAAVNWTRLKEIIEANHLFTDTASSTQGFHQIVKWVKQTAGTTAITGAAQSFVEDASYTRNQSSITAPHVFYYPTSAEDSTKFPISVIPIRAYVTFAGNGGISTNQLIYSQYNVQSVFKNSIGDFTINFTDNLPSDKYAVSFASQSTGTAGTVSIKSGSLASNVKVDLLNIATSTSNPIYVSVTIFGG